MDSFFRCLLGCTHAWDARIALLFLDGSLLFITVVGCFCMLKSAPQLVAGNALRKRLSWERRRARANTSTQIQIHANTHITRDAENRKRTHTIARSRASTRGNTKFSAHVLPRQQQHRTLQQLPPLTPGPRAVARDDS